MLRLAALNGGQTVDALPVANVVVVQSQGGGVADALVRLDTSASTWASPVGHTLVTQCTFPSSLAQTGARLVAVAILLVATLSADGLVTQVTSPATSTFASVWSTTVTIAVHTAGQLDAGLAISASPAFVAPVQ